MAKYIESTDRKEFESAVAEELRSMRENTNPMIACGGRLLSELRPVLGNFVAVEKARGTDTCTVMDAVERSFMAEMLSFYAAHAIDGAEITVLGKLRGHLNGYIDEVIADFEARGARKSELVH